MKVKIGKAEIEVYQGDITDLDVEALVNAANNRLWMGGGVAGAIKAKGGKVIEEEAVKKGPIPVGEAVVTGAGRLPAKHIIHAAVMGQDLRTDKEKVKTSTLNSLKRAEELKLTSLAFSALGTGVGRFSLYECAQIMIDVVVDFLQKTKMIKKVVFALYGQAPYEIFHKYLLEKFSSK